MKRQTRSNLREDEFRAQELGEVLTFLRLLWAIGHGLESISKRMRSTVGVTGPQRLTIRLIGRYGQAAPGDLAKILHLHRSSLTGVLHRLERAQLIKRVPDPADGRRAILTLTRRGQELNDQDSGTVESCVRRTLRGVPPAKMAVVREVLGKLADELDAESAGAVQKPARTPRGRARRAPRRRS